jgi:hypothetical protein
MITRLGPSGVGALEPEQPAQVAHHAAQSSCRQGATPRFAVGAVMVIGVTVIGDGPAFQESAQKLARNSD